MPNLSNPPHPDWCQRGPDCADGGGLHFSTLLSAAPHGNEVIQIRAGLWRMDLLPSGTFTGGLGALLPGASPGGVLLELSAGEDAERWPIDLAQSRALLPLLSGLLGRTDPALPRAA